MRLKLWRKGSEVANGYHLEGRLLEVCDCRLLCLCWIGDDPDNGTCDSVLAYHFDAGTVDGVDVTGRTIAMVSHIPGNALNGNFRLAAGQPKSSETRNTGLRHFGEWRVFMGSGPGRAGHPGMTQRCARLRIG